MNLPNSLRLVIDTNVLLVSIPPKSKYHWFYQALITRTFSTYVTTEILSEYEEVITSKLGTEASSSVIRTLIELENVTPITAYFKYQLIANDPDDDKFVNCAIAANAHYIVTHDSHFNILKEISFPKILIATLPEIQKLLYPQV